MIVKSMMLSRFAALTVVIVLAASMVTFAAQELPSTVKVIGKLPKYGEPVVVTTMGQSPGALMARMLCQSLGIKVEEKDLLTADDLVVASKTPATAYKAVIITMGTSLKGMGAAGIDIKAEEKRIKAVIDKAKELGMAIIGMQVEGPSRRVDEYDEASIRAVAPYSNLLIIRGDIDGDKYFESLAKSKNIPLVTVVQAMDAKPVLKAVFGK